LQKPVREGEPNIPKRFFFKKKHTLLNIYFFPFADPRTTLAGSNFFFNYGAQYVSQKPVREGEPKILKRF